ncbi:hypothetical protein G9464_02245 [Halostella sp. JP-L12]|uniref:HalOD1 output domain-containing protein n=1 Tax=Halostella TaxID=1843185 RepID=UPI000EF792D9|nr:MULTISPECIES: HalOD1 output domain-containing protein [Halostella]NHN46422.1 hypothetical protein [Halostella sp. JP-L12]
MSADQRQTACGETERPASERVVEAVAAVEEASPLELDRPLYDAIDPDALNALVGTQSGCNVVEFSYLGYRVAVRGDGEITVERPDT